MKILGTFVTLLAVVCGAVVVWLQRRFVEWERRKKLNGPTEGTGLLEEAGRTSRIAQSANPFDVSFEGLGLTIRYKGRPRVLLEGVSGTFRRGRLCAVMGPSGAGKTTFITVLLNKVRRTSGRVFVNGKQRDLSDYRKKIGYVPQSDILLGTETVREALFHSAITRLPNSWSSSSRRELIDEVMRVLHLEELSDRRIGDEGDAHRMSLGERKRISIGIELVSNPDCLVLDEPTSALDATNAIEVCECLQTIAQSQKTVIAVIHQPR